MFRPDYVDADSETNTALDITGHVPRYVPTPVSKLASSSNLDVLAVLSGTYANRLYIYKYFYSGQDKLQSSWSYWEYGEGVRILNIDFIETDLFLVIQRGDQLLIEHHPMEPGYKSLSNGLVAHLDRLISTANAQVVYDAAHDKTTYTFPLDIIDTSKEFIAVTHALTTISGVKLQPGVDIAITQINSRSFSVKGNFLNVVLWCGIPYTMRYSFPRALLRTQSANGGSSVVTTGRLQLRYVTLSYADAGYFRVEVTPKARAKYSYEFTGRIVDDVGNRVDQPAVVSGDYRFAVMSKNDAVSIEIISDSYLPCSFLSAEWEGFYMTQSRRF